MIIEFAEKMIDAIQAQMESKSKQRKDSINQHELPARPRFADKQMFKSFLSKYEMEVK